MPETLDLSCGSCGAGLAVAGDVRFLTCTFCGARLEVRREGGAATAAVLERLAVSTQALAGDVEALRLERELERLAGEHEVAVRSEPGRGRAGATGGGSLVPFVLMGALVVVFIGGWIGMAVQMGAPAFFVAFGGLFLVLALYTLGRGARAQRQARALEAGYQRRRAELLGRLRRTPSGAEPGLRGPDSR